ncbi:MAG TPA: D-aminoacylase [Acidimicrobiales bacterium]|nr:D-aminoacylase [Acidimicrobiales bacterium]
MTPELAIRDVRIVDGTGAPAAEGDVGIAGGRIVAVGRVGAAAADVDGRGRTLTPGFVDVHTHDDGALVNHPDLAFKTTQGCTTLVIGNCGFSAAPTVATGRRDPVLGLDVDLPDLDAFRAAVADARPAANAVALIGHNTIRTRVMGDERREPTPAELDEMRGHVRRAMEQGACGFSTGLVYEPGRYSATDEIIELAREVAPFDGLYATHMRNEGDRLIESVEETLRIVAGAGGLRAQISHHKAAGRRNWGKVAESLARVDRANAEGADVTLDVYPYTAGSGPLAQYVDAQRPDPEFSAIVRIATCPAFPAYEGRMVADIAAERGVGPDEIVKEIVNAKRGRSTLCIHFTLDEADIETNLRHPLVMVGSDGIPDLDGVPHPRLFGTFPRVLGEYVRSRGVLGFEDAVRRMTSLSCDRFGLTDRGRVVEGGWADLVLLDPDVVADTATYDDPQRHAVGIDTVWVAGAAVVDGGAPTAARPGRRLRHRDPS